MYSIDYGYCCNDCTIAVANDDYSGVDYYLSGLQADARKEAIRSGIANADGHLVIGDPIGFMHGGCDVCGSRLSGERHAVSMLLEDEPDNVEPRIS